MCKNCGNCYFLGYCQEIDGNTYDWECQNEKSDKCNFNKENYFKEDIFLTRDDYCPLWEGIVDHYMKLPYTRELIPEAEGGWFVRIKEFPGCMSQGRTIEEALKMIDDAMLGWLEVELEAGSYIPLPEEK